ncbi:hypothetical protein IMZ08_15250 [Bacillus luteolus]|uniref:Uncharacterized protein n=1 Tax=Litchfieldia luteola TaxID=682179 RepID=A0ABR9QLP3_9BACI|nr:hypothetical protein [Cytobacillus luteolus]MBE4909407.1 hypothetical protein [Cytobacillus luteolus]MBP1940806.1 hypothetical protein [Cytobacillus luteolus]
MGEHFIELFFYGNFLITTIIYLYIFRIRKLIGFQLGMNISILVGGMMGIASGVLLVSMYPFHFATVTIVSTLIGMGIGALFGALFDYQTLLTGFINGMMMGIMAPMIGAVLEGSESFILFIEILFICSSLLVITSRKSS